VLRVGLTGGIASGKSAVGRFFAGLGAALIDTDVIAREVVRPGTPGLAAIVARFGTRFLTASGELDRPLMRTAIFSDPKRREALESILHPLIRERTLTLASSVEGPYVIIAVPLLVETAFDRLVDRVLVVDCSEALQVDRLMARDGITEAEAHTIMAAQLPREARLEAADDVIDNNGTLEETRAQVEALDTRYRQLAQNCPADAGRAE
jgi:dephospho-CoA kinase